MDRGTYIHKKIYFLFFWIDDFKNQVFIKGLIFL